MTQKVLTIKIENERASQIVRDLQKHLTKGSYQKIRKNKYSK
jgi:ribosomal protein L25 (general stress protein Ctc)